MSEEILYIDDGELVYYINENEFITCDEIPYPMLEGIKHLQQKVEQLEKENKELNRMCELYSQSLYNADLTKAEKKVEQLENIRKEAIKYIEKEIKDMPLNGCKQRLTNLLNILNKGSEK